jgi:hypothetical protein
MNYLAVNVLSTASSSLHPTHFVDVTLYGERNNGEGDPYVTTVLQVQVFRHYDLLRTCGIGNQSIVVARIRDINEHLSLPQAPSHQALFRFRVHGHSDFYTNHTISESEIAATPVSIDWETELHRYY